MNRGLFEMSGKYLAQSVGYPEMKIYFLLVIYVLLVLCLLGCSIDVAQPAASSPVSAVGSASPILPPVVSPGNTTPSAIPTTIPVTWSVLNLTGSLVHISPPVTGDVSFFISIRKLNLITGEIRPVFTTTGDDWIYYVSVSPDARQLVMSYVPPSQTGVPPSRALYTIPLDGTSPPQLLFSPPTPDDHYVHAEWSPDGKYIYYAHYNSNNRLPGMLDPVYDIFRMRYPEGQAEKIADNAFWPRISSDSTNLVYVSINPASGKNELYMTNADGSNARRIVLSGSSAPEIIDAPIFSPDGQSVIFSAPPPPQAHRLNWFEKLMGIQVVKAHSVPSDWWSVPVTGGEPTRLTQLQTIRLFASISLDKKHIASLSGEGIFVMDQMGSNLMQLLFDPGVSGTVSWIP
jgi:Tol biopolymer transport system component